MKKIIKFLAGIGAVAFSIRFLISETKKKIDKEGETKRHRSYGVYERYFKRLFDFMVALLGLLFLSPVLGVVALLVRVKLGSPVIFTQERPGQKDPETGRERIFKLYKFRTMTDARDKRGELLPDEKRLTEFGKKLRSTSLDELPELFNILKGEMSLVGPRPLLVEHLPYYTENERHRHDVRPGLTGLAQVHGRNSTTWEERFAWDVKYVENITFVRDIEIMLETIIIILKKEGISSAGLAVLEEQWKKERKN